MSTPEPLPSAHRTREEIARIEVGQTTVGPAVARGLVALFVTLIAAVPVIEWTGVRAPGTEDGLPTAWAHLSRLPQEIRLHLAASAPGVADTSLVRRIVGANRLVLAGLNDFERALDDRSLLGRALRRPAQAVMSGWLGAGNERVYPGRDGWLFYRPDVEYVTGPGFLEPAQLRRRIATASEWTTPPQPDPREAILTFEADLAARGITLIVMPTPLKPGVHPEMLGPRHDSAADVLHNASYPAFVDFLRQAGVLVFDPSETLATARRAGPQYLASDTHWRPEAMEAAAERLAGVITTEVPLSKAEDPGYRIERTEARGIGDTARMLDLPAGNGLFPPEAVWLRRVLRPDGTLWRSSPDADVLLLGDSFSNIYSLESMGWGTSAGFAEQLSYTLGRPIDRLVQNDEAAFATRAMLQREPARLNGKLVVVYQFAARELALGDWRVFSLPDVRVQSPGLQPRRPARASPVEPAPFAEVQPGAIARRPGGQ